MGGKRPDQYQIDPGEAGATDYKTRDEDQGTHQQDVQKFAQSQTDKRESMIPKGGKNPALEALQAKREEKRAQDEGESSDDA